MSLIVRLSDKF